MNKELTRAISLIPNWDFDSIKHIEELANSITSKSYLILKNEQKYVLRIDKPFDQGVIPDRMNEIKTLKYLGNLSLSNKLIHSDLKHGLLVTEYIDARIWTNKDTNIYRNINNLANKLKAIHSLKPELAVYDLVSGVKRYADILQSDSSSKWADQIISLLDKCEERPQVLCHNDLHSGNILVADELIFIDWEYAGLGNPLFDVSSILQSLELSDSQSENFLNTYFEKVTSQDLEDIHRFKQIHDLLLALWLSILIKSSESQGKQDLISIKQLELVKIRINS